MARSSIKVQGMKKAATFKPLESLIELFDKIFPLLKKIKEKNRELDDKNVDLEQSRDMLRREIDNLKSPPQTKIAQEFQTSASNVLQPTTSASQACNEIIYKQIRSNQDFEMQEKCIKKVIASLYHLCMISTKKYENEMNDKEIDAANLDIISKCCNKEFSTNCFNDGIYLYLKYRKIKGNVFRLKIFHRNRDCKCPFRINLDFKKEDTGKEPTRDSIKKFIDSSNLPNKIPPCQKIKLS